MQKVANFLRWDLPARLGIFVDKRYMWRGHPQYAFVFQCMVVSRMRLSC